jgi:hypothetical protein
VYYILPDSWYSQALTIGINATTLSFDDVVSSLLPEEMRKKSMEIQSIDSLFARGHSRKEIYLSPQVIYLN